MRVGVMRVGATRVEVIKVGAMRVGVTGAVRTPLRCYIDLSIQTTIVGIMEKGALEVFDKVLKLVLRTV